MTIIINKPWNNSVYAIIVGTHFIAIMNNICEYTNHYFCLLQHTLQILLLYQERKWCVQSVLSIVHLKLWLQFRGMLVRKFVTCNFKDHCVQLLIPLLRWKRFINISKELQGRTATTVAVNDKTVLKNIDKLFSERVTKVNWHNYERVMYHHYTIILSCLFIFSNSKRKKIVHYLKKIEFFGSLPKSWCAI